MNIFYRIVNGITLTFQWTGMAAIALMMMLIVGVVTARIFGSAIPGEIELIEFAMGAIAMFGLAYVEKLGGHVSVGLLIDRMSPNWQASADLLAVAATFCTCALVGWFALSMSIKYATTNRLSSDYLSIPYWPFMLMIALGFWLWALQSVARVPAIFKNLREGRASVASGGYE